MNKIVKFAGIGCLGLIFIFVIVPFVYAIFTSDIDLEELKEEIKVENERDSLVILENKRKNDSIEDLRKKRFEKAEKALSSFRKSEDEFNGLAFYQDKRAPRYINQSFVYPYIGKNENHYYLRLKIQYTSDSWLFVKKAIFLIDGEKYIITGSWERDNDSRIWEWLDTRVASSELAILEKISNAKVVKIRYEGRKYYKDRTMTSKEKSIIKKTLEIYKDLK